MKKGMSVEKCVEKAEKVIAKHGVCLLLYDVKGSKKYEDLYKLIKRLEYMQNDLNEKYKEYFVEHDLWIPGRKEKGFLPYHGDGGRAGINSAEIIPDIITYQKNNYPDISLYWDVIRDYLDKKGMIV
jgi:hypothetical protein